MGDSVSSSRVSVHQSLGGGLGDFSFPFAFLLNPIWFFFFFTFVQSNLSLFEFRFRFNGELSISTRFGSCFMLSGLIVV